MTGWAQPARDHCWQHRHRTSRPTAGTLREGVVASATEAELGNAIVALAVLWGWRVYHPLPARTNRGWRTATQGHTGWPDLLMARQQDGQTRLLIWELKGASGRITPEQREWLRVLSSFPGIECREVRPVDWVSGRVKEWLR